MIATVSVLSAQKVHITWKPPDAGNIVGYYSEHADVEVWTEDQPKTPQVPDPASARPLCRCNWKNWSLSKTYAVTS